jgi:hypothetical protein
MNRAFYVLYIRCCYLYQQEKNNVIIEDSLVLTSNRFNLRFNKNRKESKTKPLPTKKTTIFKA